MRLPGSNLPLPNIIAWSCLLAVVSLLVGFYGGLALAWIDSPLSHFPFVVLLAVPYVVAVGLALRRGWIASARFPWLVRVLLAIPPGVILAGSVILNLLPFHGPPDGYTDDSPFATEDQLVPQTGWGRPSFYLRIFDGPLDTGERWLYYDLDAFINIWFFCSLLLAVILGEALLAGLWCFIRRRLRGPERSPQVRA